MRWIVALLGALLAGLLYLQFEGDEPAARSSDAREPAAEGPHWQKSPVPHRERGPSQSRYGEPPQKRLVDSSGHPVKGAVIQVETKDGWVDAGRTDESGNIVWDAEPSGAYVWRVLHPSVQAIPMWREADGGGFATPIEGLPFSVLVRNERKEPVAGARVTLAYTDYHEAADGRRDVGPEIGVTLTSGEDGVVAFPAMPPGSLDLHVTAIHPDYAPTTVHRGYTGGASVDPRLEIELKAGGVIEGRVLDAQDQAVSGALVTADGQQSTSDGAGAYRLVVGADAVIVRASKDGVGMGESGVLSARASMPEAVAVKPGEVRRGVDIHLFPASRVKGTVRVEGLGPVEGAPVAYVVLKAGMLEEQKVLTAEDGTFSTEPFFVVDDASVELTVGGSGTTTVERTVTVSPGRDADAGEFLLQLRGTVTGRVVDADAKPVTTGVVQVENVRVMVDDEGRFEAPGVRAGSWVAAYYSIEETSRPAALGAIVEVKPGATVQVPDIRVEARGAVIGRVFDAGGDPAVGVQVGLAPAGIPGIVDIRKWGQFRTDETGRFRADELAQGRYHAAVVHLEQGSASLTFQLDTLMTPVEFDVVAGEIEIELRMPEIGVLRARFEGDPPPEESALHVNAHWLEPVPHTGAVRLWLSTRSDGWMVVRSDWAEPLPRDGGAVITVSRQGSADWTSAPLELSTRNSTDLGSIRLDAGRSVRFDVRNPDGSVPLQVAARLGPTSGPGLYPPLIGGGEYRDGVLTLEHVPARSFVAVLDPDDAAPTLVSIPASGDVRATVRLDAPVPVTVRYPAEPADRLWVFERESGALVFVTDPKGQTELVLDHLPARPLRFVRESGPEREFEPKAGESNVVSFR